MIPPESIRDSLGSLIGWLETWRDANGAYPGFVVHRFENKRMDAVHDTAWTQSAMIRGYGNLFRKSREDRWGKAMVLAADLLASRYDPQTGKLSHTGHENERFHSLGSCALGVCALLSVADLVDTDRRGKYIHIAVDHVQRYWLDGLWVEGEGAFKFSETDLYSPREHRYVVNFNTMAAEALLAIYEVTGKQEFKDRALRVGQWLIERWSETQAVNERILAGRATTVDDPTSIWMAPGGFAYQFTESNRTPDNYVVLYAGLSLRGLHALYRATRDQRFAQMIHAQSQFILAMRDPDTRLFYHAARQGRIEKNPQFIAGAGMVLTGLLEVMPLVGTQALPEDTVRSILRRAHGNGSIPGFIGKNDTGHSHRDGGGVVWEDVAASMNWNAQWFEFLTRLVEHPAQIDVKPCTQTVQIATRRFIYRDAPATAGILSWWPPKSAGLHLYAKTWPRAWLSLYPAALYGRLRSRLRRSP